MLYKYLFWATYRLYGGLDSKSSSPKISALAITSLFQLVLLIDLFVITKKLFDLSIDLSEIHLVIASFVLLGLNYAWLFKVNNINDVIEVCKNLPKSKNNLLTILSVIIRFMI